MFMLAEFGAQQQNSNVCWNFVGGEGGIRTPDTLSGIHDFESCAFDHSATSPGARLPDSLSHRRGRGFRRVGRSLRLAVLGGTERK